MIKPKTKRIVAWIAAVFVCIFAVLLIIFISLTPVGGSPLWLFITMIASLAIGALTAGFSFFARGYDRRREQANQKLVEQMKEDTAEDEEGQTQGKPEVQTADEDKINKK